MDRSEAYEALRDPSVSRRLEAARALLHLAIPGDRRILGVARAGETDARTKRSLDKALDAIAGVPSGVDSESINDDAWLDPAQLRARALQEATGLLLHELQPVVGLLQARASREVPDYAESKTVLSVCRLQGLLEAFEHLRKAAAAARHAELDLSEVVIGALNESDWDRDRVVPARDEPVVATGDGSLIRLVLVNIVRNALEATEALPSEARRPVIINWGATDRDAWVGVLDEGIGLPEGADRLWLPGVTTKSKDDHRGFGLYIARQAADSLGGGLQLQSRQGRGTAAELRWPLSSA